MTTRQWRALLDREAEEIAAAILASDYARDWPEYSGPVAVIERALDDIVQDADGDGHCRWSCPNPPPVDASRIGCWINDRSDLVLMELAREGGRKGDGQRGDGKGNTAPHL